MEELSLLQCSVDEFEQRLGGLIVGQTKVGIDFVVGGLLAAEGCDRNPCRLQHIAKTLRLSARVRVVRDVEEQEWRNPFALGHVIDC